MRVAVRTALMPGGIMFKLLTWITALAALAVLAWMLLLPVVVTAQLRQSTGFDASFKSLMVNPLTGRVVARDFELLNSPTFPRREFLQMREFEVEAELTTLFSEKPVFRRVRIDVALLALVKREDGRTNAEVFRSYLDGDQVQPRSAGRRPFLIKKLEVKFDRFMIVDYTVRDPAMHEFALQFDRSFENVSDKQQLLLPSSIEQLFALGDSVRSLLPADIAGAVDRALMSGGDVMRELARSKPAIFSGFTDALEESKKP